jgi:hypothetical protein
LLPFDPDEVSIDVSKHFRNAWMRKWDWDQVELREAIRATHRVSRVAKNKWELFVRKRGEKKPVIIYESGPGEVFIVTGSEG